jgi:hypothetical protein
LKLLQASYHQRLLKDLVAATKVATPCQAELVRYLRDFSGMNDPDTWSIFDSNVIIEALETQEVRATLPNYYSARVDLLAHILQDYSRRESFHKSQLQKQLSYYHQASQWLCFCNLICVQ